MKGSKKDLIWKLFHTASSFSVSDIKKPPETIPDSWIEPFYKSYARFQNYQLPQPIGLSTNLQEVLEKRTSIRNFSDKPIEKNEISTILKYSSGIKSYELDPKIPPKRFYPSAGARYPIETYLILNKSAYPKGIYHYFPKTHSLERLWNCKKKH